MTYNVVRMKKMDEEIGRERNFITLVRKAMMDNDVYSVIRKIRASERELTEKRIKKDLDKIGTSFVNYAPEITLKYNYYNDFILITWEDWENFWVNLK